MAAVIVDTSVLVACFRDKTQTNAARLAFELGARDIGMLPLIHAELLCGAKSEGEWAKLESFIAAQVQLEAGPEIWIEAARIYFDCRRGGATVRKLADCFIAAAAISTGCAIVHDDRDVEVIASVRPLDQVRLELV